MGRYLNSCNGDVNKSIDLYKYNIQVSQALYPIISVLEVALRNSIDRELAKYFNDVDWLLTQRNKFANHPNLTYRDKYGKVYPDYFFLTKLKGAEDKLQFKKIRITHGKLLSELTFGFWVKFFDISPIKILGGAPLNSFKNKPKIKLASVNSHLNSIVILRNRISHSEPICFDKNGDLCLYTLQKHENDIFESLNWLDNDLAIWAQKMNFFKPVYNRIIGI